MTPTLLEDRLFESAVEPTPEQTAANNAHFKAKGYDIEEVPADGTGDVKKPPVVVEEKPPVTDPAPETKVETAPVAKPAEVSTTEVPGTAGEPESDEDALAEWNKAPANDGEKLSVKLGRTAQKTKVFNQVKADRDRLAVLAEERLTRLKEVEAQLASGKPAAAGTSTLEPAKSTAPAAAAPAAEPIEIKPREFEKKKPVRPKLSEFADQDDPHEAHQAALETYDEQIYDFRREQERFLASEEQRVAKEKSELEQKRTQQAEVSQVVAARFAEARQTYSDFDARVNVMRVTPVMRYLLGEKLVNGCHLAYELTKPENADVLQELFDSTKDVQPTQIGDALVDTEVRLREFARSLKTEPKPEPTTAAAAAPVETKQTPPNTPPKREVAAPTPIRGRVVEPELTPEKVDPMDSDARRDVRKKLGQL